MNLLQTPQNNIHTSLQKQLYIMSTTKDVVSSCANCGKGEEESNKLKNCTACMMVKYCNRDCQISHRSQHKKECKKRAAELHDEKLFKQPPPSEDCPICLLRMPTLRSGRKYMECCGKMICGGCSHAPLYDHLGNKVDNQKCPFCRTPQAYSDEVLNERLKKRVEAKDPIAIFNMGVYYRDGEYGFQKDYTKALELFHRAAKLGYAAAYCGIGAAYLHGEGVEVDENEAVQKVIHYYELAAMRGSVEGRYNLGCDEENTGNMDRALRHYMIAVGSGDAPSLKKVKDFYKDGYATKGDYTKALQSYQTYLDEIKSDQRDEAATAREDYRYH